MSEPVDGLKRLADEADQRVEAIRQRASDRLNMTHEPVGKYHEPSTVWTADAIELHCCGHVVKRVVSATTPAEEPTIESRSEMACGRYIDYIGRDETPVEQTIWRTVWCWSDGLITTQPVRPERVATDLRKPIEWEKVSDVWIRDPDGWRGDDAPSVDEPLTWDDFAQRQMRCTVESKDYFDEERRSVFAPDSEEESEG
jgi:hypothetical protein